MFFLTGNLQYILSWNFVKIILNLLQNDLKTGPKYTCFVSRDEKYVLKQNNFTPNLLNSFIDVRNVGINSNRKKYNYMIKGFALLNRLLFTKNHGFSFFDVVSLHKMINYHHVRSLRITYNNAQKMTQNQTHKIS